MPLKKKGKTIPKKSSNKVNEILSNFYLSTIRDDGPKVKNYQRSNSNFHLSTKKLNLNQTFNYRPIITRSTKMIKHNSSNNIFLKLKKGKKIL